MIDTWLTKSKINNFVEKLTKKLFYEKISANKLTVMGLFLGLISALIIYLSGILFEHIGSKLGSLIIERFFELKWLIKLDDKNIILSNKGISGLKSLGVKIKRYNLT